ncbi:MAG: type I DNA topoisomerase [Deltaproteobacteria bacterium]|nr:type I DNA topoisomerase [Deltaproteobacteria bacterium]
MAKSLLVVESPTKAATIKKILGPEFDVQATVGHILDLPHNELGVDVEKGFTPSYKVISGKEKVIKELKKAAQKADAVYLAADPDREGEAIAWHIAESLGKKDRVYRVLFHELTRHGISQAMESPGTLDRKKYESQVARRVLDRLVGYQISPILWKKVRSGLSAGRVQSVALRLIVEREREIQAFVPEEYWTILARLDAKVPPEIEARLLKFKNKAIKIPNKEEADEILASLKGVEFHVKDISKKAQSRKPVPPFTTSTLQQEGVRKLRFTTKRTNMLAQRLYEGVELGNEGQVGLVTYIRTDSTRLAPEAQKEANRLIRERYGNDYAPAKPPVYKNRKHSQDAHEAVRPTDPWRTPDDVQPFLEPDLFKLYELIWKRFVASQMQPAEIDLTAIDISAGDYIFRATGSVVRFPGFMAVYTESTEDKPENAADHLLPGVEAGEKLKFKAFVPSQHFTKPPSRFSEASLVKELEEKGIGRPSTYAAILSNIQDRSYALREKGKFHPTELGYVVNDLLVSSFPDIMDVRFTAQMEEQLDDVEEGKVEWVQILESFYSPFSKELEIAQKEMRKGVPTGIKCEKCGNEMEIRIGKAGPFLACPGFPDCKNTKNFQRNERGEVVVLDEEKVEIAERCPKCGSEMTLKRGRYGAFIACTSYPDCKSTMPYGNQGAPQAQPPEETDEVCEKCGSKMLIKTSRFGGKFLACSNYPACKNAKPIGLGISCPQDGCNGELTERKSKRGVFYGCTNYPTCKFATWNKPIAEQCPQCGAPFLIEKFSKKKGAYLACPKKECGFTREIASE